METKELKIEIPEGYEIDKENSTFEKIVFKKKEKISPTTWEEYRIYLSGKYGYKSEVNTKPFPRGFACPEYNVFQTLEESKAFIALGKLIQLRDAWWEAYGWKPNWESGTEPKHCLYMKGGQIHYEICFNNQHIFAFPTPDMRKKFHITFAELLITAKSLI